VLFNDTIAANIAYGAMNASTDAIERAAEAANALDSGAARQLRHGRRRARR
jgi:ABC-type multidrug transport system fused ATPase/permease subunit